MDSYMAIHEECFMACRNLHQPILLTTWRVTQCFDFFDENVNFHEVKPIQPIKPFFLRKT